MIESVLAEIDPIEAAKFAAGVVVAGFSCAATGRVVEKIGSAVRKQGGDEKTVTGAALRGLGSTIETGGRGLFNLGKYGAYTVLVPMYIAGYIVPKWTITVGIPNSINFLVHRIICPAVKKTCELIDRLIECVGDAFIWTVEELILPVHAAAHAVMKATFHCFVRLPIQCMTRFVIKPIIRVIMGIASIVLSIPGMVYRAARRVIYFLTLPLKGIAKLIQIVVQTAIEDIRLLFRVTKPPILMAAREIAWSARGVAQAVSRVVKEVFKDIAGIFYLVYAVLRLHSVARDRT
jgi:hypothetical protein